MLVHRSYLKLCVLILAAALTGSAAPGRAASALADDVLLTLPFENISGRAEYNWVGDSFAVLLADLLDVPGIAVLTPDERHLAYERTGIKPGDLLTRAAEIKMAELAQANLALVGTYDIGGDKKGGATIAISARLIETREGRLVGNKTFNFSGPLSELQSMQGQLAWSILYERDPALPYSREQMIRRARGVPQRAYESYVKGIQTTDLKLRENFLRRAIKEYNSEESAGHYAQAIYELGMLKYRQREFAEAARTFKELVKDDPRYAEGLFFLGLAAYSQGNLGEAAEAFAKLAALRPLPEVLNNAGALLAAKGDAARGLPYLERAVAVSSQDAAARFNYGYALWRNQKYAEAVPHLSAVVAANARDGEAQYVLAKSLAAAGKQMEATQADQEARRYLGNYAKWEVAPDKIPLLVRLKLDFNRAAFYRLERTQAGVPNAPGAQARATQQSLDRARQLIEAKNDAEALAEIQRVLTGEPTLAEAHLLRAQVLQRRGEIEPALNAYAAAAHWNPRLVAAHVALGQIYLARGDRLRAMTHSRQALEIDPQDRDAVALKRQIEIAR
jgi:Tfp pilus assembly protein PilF/TolB-like protein